MNHFWTFFAFPLNMFLALLSVLGVLMAAAIMTALTYGVIWLI